MFLIYICQESIIRKKITGNDIIKRKVIKRNINHINVIGLLALLISICVNLIILNSII